MEPKISVVIPIYNTERYLRECLNSIINQTFEDIEIICINDGSTDNSAKILEEFKSKDERIVVIHRESSSGSAAVPRNTGLSIARGKYIIFLDSDDYFDLTMFEKMFQQAEEKSVELVMCDNFIVSGIDGSVKESDGELHHQYINWEGVFSYKDIKDKIFQISNATAWHKLILRDVILRNRLEFQENVPILDDMFFVNLLLVLSKSIYILDEKLVYYRELREESQTSAIEKHIDSFYLVFYKLNQYLLEHQIYDEVRVSLQNWTLDTMAWWYNSIKKRNIAEKFYYLCRNDYIYSLKLTNMKDSELYHRKDFYEYILEGKYRDSLNVILYSKLNKGAKVVLYGAGKFGKDVYADIMREQIYKIVLWCDKNADKIANPLVQVPEKIMSYDYDLIFIAIIDKKIVAEVEVYLQKMGVDKEKIYSFE